MEQDVGKGVGICGIYCGTCPRYLAHRLNDTEEMEKIHHETGVPVDQIRCDGCLSDVRAAPCQDCDIRDCAVSRGITHCAQCAEFPCQLITDFNNDIFAHHSEVLENIQRQRDIGIDEWLEEQRQRWRCPGCGRESDWYATECIQCGAALEDHF